MDIVSRVTRLIKDPFKDEGDIVDFFLFIGLVMVVAIAWSRLLKYIID